MVLLGKLKKFLKRAGPGIISGGADNDPAGISTYSVAGAQFGYSLNWLMVASTPMLIAVQAMCARLGDVKRKGLTLIFKDYFPTPVVWLATAILLITNTATIGADLTGMSAALGLVTGVNHLFWVIPTAVFTWYIVVFKNYKTIARYLLWLVVVFVSYIFAAILAKPDWGQVLKAAFVPQANFSAKYFLASLGLLGTTITPFLFFWQTKEEVENHRLKKESLRVARQEEQILAPGFIFSNLISLFIMISTASVLFKNGITDITSASQAARSLEPFAGQFAKLLFAIGIVGSGLVAVPVLSASTAYVVAETFGWRDSLSDKPARARGFYTVITGAIVAGAAITLSGVDPIKALFYSQVLSGILGPFLIILILLLCNNRAVMGKYVNGWFDNLFGWLAVLVMLLGSAGLFWQIAKGG